MIVTTRITLVTFSIGFALGLATSYKYFKHQYSPYQSQLENCLKREILQKRINSEMDKDFTMVLKYSGDNLLLSKIQPPLTTTTAPISTIGTSTTTEPSTEIYTAEEILAMSTTTEAPELIVEERNNHCSNETMHQLEDLEEVKLTNSVRILCFILTTPSSHKTKAIHIKRTWGQRCNKLVFISSEPDPELEPVILVGNITEGRNILWTKTRRAIQEIYKQYLNEADWFLKADDDTYVVVENLRYMLKNFNPNDTHYFGATFHPRWLDFDYMSGGAGYVLSKRTLEKLVEEAFHFTNISHCRPDNIAGEPAEDMEVGRCIKSLNISASDSRDELGRMRFFPFPADTHIFHSKLNASGFTWWWQYTKYSQLDGLECCSDTAIAFHYVSPHSLYLYEYLLYHLRPFGIRQHVHTSKISTTETELVVVDRTTETTDTEYYRAQSTDTSESDPMTTDQPEEINSVTIPAEA